MPVFVEFLAGATEYMTACVRNVVVTRNTDCNVRTRPVNPRTHSVEQPRAREGEGAVRCR